MYQQSDHDGAGPVLTAARADSRPRAMGTEAARVRVGEGGSSRTCAKGEAVFAQGDSAAAVFYVQSGELKVSVVSAQGKEAIVTILEPGDFFGEDCLAGHLRRLATTSAMTDCAILRLEKPAILRLLKDDPAFSATFVSHLLQRAIRVEADLVDQLFNSSEKRLARALLRLVDFDREGRLKKPIAPISQETLAEMVGTTRSRVSFFINKFRRLGFIDYDGGIEVHSSLLSVVLNDRPHDVVTLRRDRQVDPADPCR